MWCCFHWVVMEFMWQGFPPSASCPSPPRCFIYVCTHPLFRQSSAIQSNGRWEWEKRLRLSQGGDAFGFGWGLKFPMIDNSTLLDMTDNIIRFCSGSLIIKFPSDWTACLRGADASVSACHRSCTASPYRPQRTLELALQGDKVQAQRQKKKTTYN